MWLLFSQLSAVTEAISTVLAKKSMEEYDSSVVSWFWVTSSLLLLGSSLFIWGIPEIQPIFYAILIGRVALDTVALLLYTKAIQLEDISLVTPLYNFSAIFTLLFSFLINRELPSWMGIAGVLTIVLGAYLLNFDSKNKNPLHPLLALFTRKGPFLMILSTILFGVIFSMSKVGIQASSWSFYTFASAACMSVTLFPIAYATNKKDIKKILKFKNAIRVLPLGIVDGVKILALMLTISTSYVSYADASNNTSMLYNVVLGKVFLKEKVHKRVLPILFMFIGLMMIVFS